MAPPLFHSFLQKGIYQSGKLDTILFYFEWKSGGAIRNLFPCFLGYKNYIPFTDFQQNVTLV